MLGFSRSINFWRCSGDPGRTRTDNIQLRRLALYPVELRGPQNYFSTEYYSGGRTTWGCIESRAARSSLRIARFFAIPKSRALVKPKETVEHKIDADIVERLISARKRVAPDEPK